MSSNSYIVGLMVTAAFSVYISVVTSETNSPSSLQQTRNLVNVTRKFDGDIVYGYSDCDDIYGISVQSQQEQHGCKCLNNTTFYTLNNGPPDDPWDGEDAKCWHEFRSGYNVTTERTHWGVGYLRLEGGDEWWTIQNDNSKLKLVNPNSRPLEWCTYLQISLNWDWIEFMDIPQSNQQAQMMLQHKAVKYFHITWDGGAYHLEVDTNDTLLAGRLISLTLNCTTNLTYNNFHHEEFKMLLKFSGIFGYSFAVPPVPPSTPTGSPSSSSSTKKPKKSSSSNTGAIVGGAIGGVVVLVLLIVLVVICIKRRSNDDKKSAVPGQQQQQFQNGTIGGIYTAPTYAYPNLSEAEYIQPNAAKPSTGNGLNPNEPPPVPRSPRPSQRPLSANIQPGAEYIDMSNGEAGSGRNGGNEQYTELTGYQSNNTNENNNIQNGRSQKLNSYAQLNQPQGISNANPTEDYLDFTAVDSRQPNVPSLSSNNTTYAGLDNNAVAKDQQYADLTNPSQPTPPSPQQQLQNYSSLTNQTRSRLNQAYEDLMY